MPGVTEIGDELYALPPQSFTAARNERVAEARKSGDRATAAELATLKRPSVAAWLVNLVALRRPESVQRLIALGETLREAQRSMTRGPKTPARLRDLSAQRRHAIDAMVAELRTLAAEAGEPAPTTQHLAEVESTLAAAMADESAAAQVSSRRLIKALSYSGFGQAMPAGSTPTAPAGPPAPTVDEEARRAAARVRVDEARDALARAVRDEHDATAQADRLAERLTDLRDRLEEARRAAKAARQARMAAEGDLGTLERRLARLGGSD